METGNPNIGEHMTKDEAIRLALEALQGSGYYDTTQQREAITALRQALEQPADEIDWKDQYEKQKRRAEMWVAKYEKDIGPVEKAVPMQQPADEPVAYIKTMIDALYENGDPVSVEAAELMEKLYTRPQPAAQSVTYQLSPTDIYDFAGWLTTRKGVMTVGSSCEAGPMAEAVGEYLKTFPERFNVQPAAQWVGLTDEERRDALVSVDAETKRLPPGFKDFARAIETKLKEKNT